MTEAVRAESVTKLALANDSDYTLQVIRWVLKPIGVWPKSKDSSVAEKFLTELLAFVCCLGILSTMVPCALNTALGEDADIRLNSLGPLSFWVMAILKFYLLLRHGDGIRSCVQHIENDWSRVRNKEDRETLLSNAKTGRYIVLVCMLFMQGGVFSYEFVKGMSTDVAVIDNESVTIRTVPVPFYNGIADTRFSPIFEIVFVIECFSGFVVNSTTVGACTVGTMFVMHACGQLDILMARLQNFVDAPEKIYGNFQTKLTAAVRHHLRALSFISRVEEILCQICFIEIVGCTINICLLGYYSIMEWERNNPKASISLSIAFLSICFNIFIFCYIGEILSEQCRLVGEIAYMSEWYRLPRKTALCFILIILRASSVTKLTAGNLFQLSLATFGNVIRTSLAYLNIIRTMTA